MFEYWPYIPLVVSAILVIAIFVRKFPLLAVLDIETVQAEREARFKERILSSRLRRAFYKRWSAWLNAWRPLLHASRDLWYWLLRFLRDFRENYNKESMDYADPEKAVVQLYTEAEESVKKEDYDVAEKRYIEIIRLTPKDHQAFYSLGRLYALRRNYLEARQTLEHALRLLDKEEGLAKAAMGDEVKEDELRKLDLRIASICHELSVVAMAVENYQEAMKQSKRALAIEPNNPRYLDTRIESSIIMKDKIAALLSFEILAKVNPENGKLPIFKKRIADL